MGDGAANIDNHRQDALGDKPGTVTDDRDRCAAFFAKEGETSEEHYLRRFDTPLPKGETWNDIGPEVATYLKAGHIVTGINEIVHIFREVGSESLDECLVNEIFVKIEVANTH